MRKSIVGVLALGLVGSVGLLAAPGAAGQSDEVMECEALEVPAKLDVDLSGMSHHDLRFLLSRAMFVAGPFFNQAASDALDGDIDDVRAFLEGGWVGPYEDDLLARLGQIAHNARPEVKADANAALDAGTVEAYEDFLRKYNCEEQPPEETTTTTTAPGATTTTIAGATTSTTVGQPSETPVPAPATPIPGKPNTTG